MGTHFFLVVNVITTAVATAILSYFYGNWKKQNKFVTVVHYLSWWLPALILTTLPVDVATAYYSSCNTSSTFTTEQRHCRPPLLSADSDVLLVFWHIVYWTSQLLTWFVIPIMRSFSTSGDFTTAAMLKTAVVDNAIQCATNLGIFATALIYLVATKAIKLEFDYLKVLLITTANTWGLFIVILFLGYGLVEVPRSLWIAANLLTSLRRAYFRLSKRSMELADEEDKLTDLVERVQQLKSTLPLNHPLQPKLLIVVRQAHQSSNRTDSHRKSSPAPRPEPPPTTYTDASGLSLKQLVLLHRSLKSTQHRRNRAEALYLEAVEDALWLEDLNAFRSKHHAGAFSQTHSGWLSRTMHDRAPTVAFSLLAHVQFFWYCHARPWVIRALAISLAAFSVLMVWSECTFFVRSPTLSVVAWLVKAEAAQHDYFLLELSSFFTLGYLSFVVFYTVFRLRLFNYYRLVGSHHTDENSLLFCGSLLCRLTPSLCLNFLGLAHLDNHIAVTTLPQSITKTVDSVLGPVVSGGDPVEVSATAAAVATGLNRVSYRVETTYTRFMGHLDVIPFIARGFNIYFPILVVLLCVLTYIRFGERVLRQLGLPELLSDSMTDTSQSGNDAANSLVEDAIQDGRLLLRQERMMLSRRSRPSVELSRPSLSLRNIKPKISTSHTDERVHLLLEQGDAAGDENGEEETDLLPPMQAPLVEYSETQIESQFQLGIRR